MVVAGMVASNRTDVSAVDRCRYSDWSSHFVRRLDNRELRGEFRVGTIRYIESHFGMQERPAMWFAGGTDVADDMVVCGRVVHRNERAKSSRTFTEIQRLLRWHGKRCRLPSAGHYGQGDTTCHNPD